MHIRCLNTNHIPPDSARHGNESTAEPAAGDNVVTVGQLLTIPMVAFGGLLMWLAYRGPGNEERAAT